MAKFVLRDEFYVTVYSRAGLSTAEDDAIRRSLNRRRFQAALARVARRLLHNDLARGLVKVRVSR